jgi:hypothetical protein
MTLGGRMKAKKLSLFFVVLAAVLFPLHAANADDPFVFEKGNFRIQYTGNGGNCAGCEWIAIDGEIPSEAGAYLEGFVSKNGLNGIPMQIYFNSPGGDLAGAIRLARLFVKWG